MIKPKGSKIIVEECVAKIHPCMIVLPNKNEKMKRFVVIEVGPGKRNANGDYIPIDVKEGDIVLANTYGIELDMPLKGLFYIHEDDIVGVIDGESK